MMLLHDSVRYWADARPEACAVILGEQRLTYGELELSSNRLAQLLRASGCGRGDRVALLLPKSIPAIVAVLGALKADCIYVPLDIASPPARLARMLAVCEPTCVLASTASRPLLAALLAKGEPWCASRLGWLDLDPPSGGEFDVAFCARDFDAVSPAAPESRNAPEDAAHILFTSGSTGIPKGVVITHANVGHFLHWAVKYFEIDRSDRISCHPPLHFDLSTFDIHGTFLAGAELHLVPPEISFLPHKLASFIRDSNLTQWFSVPAALKFMVQFDVIGMNDFPSLKRLLWCGERLPTPTLIHLMKRLPGVKFTNLYGPTETTIASSYYTVPRRPEHDRVDIPIGSACEGERLSVLNDQLQACPPGEAGDLYISGAGLSPGYWRDPEKTRSAFLEHETYGRIYKTGDLAKVGEDGLTYILGRSDSQIKSRGHRIELGEIETALHSLSLLRECAVVGVEVTAFEGTTICCAYVPQPGRTVSTHDLRRRLGELVPRYMIPSHWLELSKLPLNTNGKCDRRQLRTQFQACINAA